MPTLKLFWPSPKEIVRGVRARATKTKTSTSSSVLRRDEARERLPTRRRTSLSTRTVTKTVSFWAIPQPRMTAFCWTTGWLLTKSRQRQRRKILPSARAHGRVHTKRQPVLSHQTQSYRMALTVPRQQAMPSQIPGGTAMSPVKSDAASWTTIWKTVTSSRSMLCDRARKQCGSPSHAFTATVFTQCSTSRLANLLSSMSVS
mmetsp:Transcript_53858/g.132020  ORF Transcript_53858/g.132020 Transcript_53858/m.132020 type:complete len:202 (+) Transcript_53858:683-1288(+)